MCVGISHILGAAFSNTGHQPMVAPPKRTGHRQVYEKRFDSSNKQKKNLLASRGLGKKPREHDRNRESQNPVRFTG